MHTSDITELLKQVYLPRPEMPLSSLGSKDEEEEERCENAALRSEAVWLVVVVAAAGMGGWGLHSPVRLSKGTGVIDAEVTSLVLAWGFTWFLLQRKKETMSMLTNMTILFTHTGNQCFLSSVLLEGAILNFVAVLRRPYWLFLHQMPLTILICLPAFKASIKTGKAVETRNILDIIKSISEHVILLTTVLPF